MRILLIRPGALGDTILTLPIIAAILQKHPGSHLTLLGNPQYGFLLPEAVNADSFDSLKWSWIFEPKSGPSHNSVILPELAYVILKNHKLVTESLRSAGIETIVASSQPEEGKSIVETLCERLSLPVPERQPYLKRMTRSEPSNRVWLAPGSGSLIKNASPDLFRNVLESVCKHYDLQPVITLGEADATLLNDEHFRTLGTKQQPDITYNKSLEFIITTYCNSRIYIGNDSGVSHLAAALDIPCILFFTITDPRIWAPYTKTERLLVLRLRDQTTLSEESHNEIHSQIRAFLLRKLPLPQTRPSI